MRLARDNSTYSPFDSDAVQYFAAHVYALEVAKGGDECIGDIAGKANEAHEAPAGNGGAAPAPSTSTDAAPEAQASGNDCHTHADGTVHCGAH